MKAAIQFLATSLKNYAIAMAIAISFVLFVLVLDAVEYVGSSTTTNTPQSKGSGYSEYVNRVSLYSLASLDLVDIYRGREIQVTRTSAPFNCVGNLRGEYNGAFVDLTALTLSIVAVENYNRAALRRQIEIILQDFAHKAGVEADYTIGLAQIRSSFAEKLYRSKIDATATIEKTRAFARNNCGSALLASLALEGYLNECSPSSNTTEKLIECAAQKYNGAEPKNNKRTLYSDIALRSYEHLFDSSNEFFAGHFYALHNIGIIRAGECAEFNAGRLQFRYSPKDKSSELSSGTDEDEAERAFIEINSERIEYSKLDSESRGGLVKIFAPRQQLPFSNEYEKQEILLRYVCAKFEPIAVDFYPAQPLLPGQLAKYCSGTTEKGASESSFVLISTTGKPGGKLADTQKCGASPTPNKKK